MKSKRMLVFWGILCATFALFLSLPGLGITNLSGTKSLVKNIRIGQASDYIRVVFDLERQAVYEHQRVRNSNRVTITIRSVVLGQDAQQAIVNAGVPHPMKI